MVKNARTIGDTRTRCTEPATNAIIANSVPRVSLFNVLHSPSVSLDRLHGLFASVEIIRTSLVESAFVCLSYTLNWN